MFSVDDHGLYHTNDAPKVVLNTYSYITSVINIKIRRHLGMASRKSIGTNNSNTLIHVISVEFTLHS